jgi:hypothetical protein
VVAMMALTTILAGFQQTPFFISSPWKKLSCGIW